MRAETVRAAAGGWGAVACGVGVGPVAVRLRGTGWGGGVRLAASAVRPMSTATSTRIRRPNMVKILDRFVHGAFRLVKEALTDADTQGASRGVNGKSLVRARRKATGLRTSQ